MRNNPWMGLESYQENQILYGRNCEIADLSQRVLNDVDTVLYGKSGIGKTSIINAGVLPEVRKNGYLPIVIRLDHSNTVSYIRQISESIYKHVDIDEKIPSIDISNELFWEFFHRHVFLKDGHRVKLMLIFDQFEEIFTLQNNPTLRIDFFRNLGYELNDIMPKELVNSSDDGVSSSTEDDSQVEGFSSMADIFKSTDIGDDINSSQYITDNIVHFVFTLREDFLSEFEYYTTKIPSLKIHRFGLRPLNEEQAAEIITRPCPGLVSIEVAHQIIETITGRSDFSLGDEPELEVDAAVLSLFLSRIYQKLGEDDEQISSQIVKQFGADIIKDFYIESIATLSPSEIDLLEDSLLTSNGRRNNISYSDFCESIDKQKVDDLIWQRKLLRTFNYGNDIRLEFIHDILCSVVKERKESREQLRIQEEEKQKAIAEEKHKREESERRAAAEKAEMEAEALQIKAKNRRRLASVIFGSLFIAFIVGAYLFWDYWYNKKSFNDNYANYELLNGWPKGIGCCLTLEECKHAPLYYQLCYKGAKNKGHYTDIYIKSSNENLSENCRIPSLEWCNLPSTIEEKSYNNILSNIERIHFSSNEGDTFISQQEMYGKDNSLLITCSYYHTSNNCAIVRFVTLDGRNMDIRSNGITRIKLNWDAKGRIISRLYYDDTGVQQSISNENNIKGYIWDYSKRDTIVRYSVNEYGMPTPDVDVNTLILVNKEDHTEKVYAHTVQIGQTYKEVACREGYSYSMEAQDIITLYNSDRTLKAIRHYLKDDYGNITSIVTEGDTTFGYPPIINIKYDNGRKVHEEHYTSNDKAFTGNPNGIFMWDYSYDKNGIIIEEIQTNFKGEVCFHKKMSSSVLQGVEINTISLLDITNDYHYYEKVDSVIGNTTITRYYGKDHILINYPIVIGSDSMSVHRIKTTESISDGKKTVVKEISKSDGNRVVAMPANMVDGMPKEYYKRTEEFDGDGNKTSILLQDKDGNILKSMMYFYQGGNRVGRAVRGIDGAPVRCNIWEEDGFMYYKLLYNKNDEGNFSCLYPVDEWGHRSTILSPWGEYVNPQLRNFKGLPILINWQDEEMSFPTEVYNNYSQMVFGPDSYKSNCEVAYIHAISKESLIRKELNFICDGCIVSELGSWKKGMPLDILESEWEMMLSRKGIVHLQVLSPTRQGFSVSNISINNDGFEFKRVHLHRMYLSNEERELFNKEITYE